MPGVSHVTPLPNWTGYATEPFFTERHGPGRVPDPPVRNDRDRPLLSLERDSIRFVNGWVLSLASFLTVHERPGGLQK